MFCPAQTQQTVRQRRQPTPPRLQRTVQYHRLSSTGMPGQRTMFLQPSSLTPTTTPTTTVTLQRFTWSTSTTSLQEQQLSTMTTTAQEQQTRPPSTIPTTRISLPRVPPCRHWALWTWISNVLLPCINTSHQHQGRHQQQP